MRIVPVLTLLLVLLPSAAVAMPCCEAPPADDCCGSTGDCPPGPSGDCALSTGIAPLVPATNVGLDVPSAARAAIEPLPAVRAHGGSSPGGVGRAPPVPLYLSLATLRN